MTKRLVLTPAIGLFAGLSVISYGALMSMLLNGAHGAGLASSNPCTPPTSSPTATATTKALVRPAARTGAQHPAGMPVLLADVVKLVSTDKQAGANHLARQASVTASPTPTPSLPPLPQPSPGTSARPQPSTLPQPGPAKSASSNAQLQPGGGATSTSSSATPTTTPTSTATPTNTPTTPPPGTLCLTMQTLNNVTAVDPHTTVGFAIWVWLTSGSSGTAKVTLSAKPSSVSPTFSVCALAGTSNCTVGGLKAGQKVEVQAKLAAPDRPATNFTLTARATSTEASNSATASATVNIKPKNQPAPSSSPSPNAGDGAFLPPAAGLPGGSTIPGVGVQQPGDLGSAFPQVSPSPSTSGAAAAAHGHTTRTIDLSAGLPLTVRLIGGQVIGLAVLAAAVTIAVARLSLRKQPARHGEDGPGS
jgi:hypothetical protein